MTVNDLQSGIGLHRPSNMNEEDGVISTNNDIANETTRKTMYTTKSEVRKQEMKEKAQQSLNSSCNCGSNKKYKNCCIKKEL